MIEWPCMHLQLSESLIHSLLSRLTLCVKETTDKFCKVHCNTHNSINSSINITCMDWTFFSFLHWHWPVKCNNNFFTTETIKANVNRQPDWGQSGLSLVLTLSFTLSLACDWKARGENCTHEREREKTLSLSLSLSLSLALSEVMRYH